MVCILLDLLLHMYDCACVNGMVSSVFKHFTYIILQFAFFTYCVLELFFTCTYKCAYFLSTALCFSIQWIFYNLRYYSIKLFYT